MSIALVVPENAHRFFGVIVEGISEFADLAARLPNGLTHLKGDELSKDLALATDQTS